MIESMPDAFPLDLRERFFASPPIEIEQSRVRMKHEQADEISPMILIAAGDPKRFPQMDGTGRLPISMELRTSLDAVTPEQHRSMAALLNSWWIAIRSARGDIDAFARCYLHDLLFQPPSLIEYLREGTRMQATTFRAEAILTMIDRS